MLKDSQIDDLGPEQVNSWELEDTHFNTVDEWLEDKDKGKKFPVETEDENSKPDIQVPETDFSWETGEFETENVSDVINTLAD